MTASNDTHTHSDKIRKQTWVSASSCPKNSVSARPDEFLNTSTLDVFSKFQPFMCLQKDKTHRERYSLRNNDVSVDRACVAINACSWSHVGGDRLCASNSKRKKLKYHKKLSHCCSLFFINTLNFSTLKKCNGKRRTIVQQKKTANK